MISEEQIKHLAKLAKIELSSKEIKIFQKQLKKVFDYVGQLNSIKIKDKGKLQSICSEFREDEPKQSLRELRNELLKASYYKKGDYFEVPGIFDEN